jgi:hypothetical protein
MFLIVFERRADPLEALFGQFYIAVVVAQLAGARLSQAR